MSDNLISPDSAAAFCEAVYGILGNRQVAQGFNRRYPEHGLEQNWDLNGASVGEATSGTFTPSQTGFAAVVPGKSGGLRSTETVVAVRGTQGTFLLSPDWQTNFDMRADFAAGGGLVHSGFNDVEAGLQRPVMQALDALPSSRKQTIHVAGHSLGGAVANLLALRIAKSLRSSVKLYTFGAPRPGTDTFLQSLVTEIGKDNIYRVFNQRDVVPMIPLYPFGHAAIDDRGIAVGQSAAGISFFSEHVMPSGYIPKVKKMDWNALKAASVDVINLRRVDYWLDQAAQNTFIPGTAMGLRFIGRALQAILDLSSAALGSKLFASATALDMIVKTMIAGGRVLSGLGNRVISLIRSILKWTGRAVLIPTISVTAAFLHYVLDLMFRPLVAMANSALEVFDRIG